MASGNKFYWQGGFDMLLLFFPRNNNQGIVLANKNKFFWQGGFDMIRSGRDKIETPEQVGLLCLSFCCLNCSFELLYIFKSE